MVTRGFFGLRRPKPPREIPPGQYYETGFPTLTAGPTPKVDTDVWSFNISRRDKQLASWDWDQFMALSQEEITTDLHCVTKWTKLDTHWKGVSLDLLLADVENDGNRHVMVTSYGGYTTNLPLRDLTGGKAWVAWEYEGAPLERKHGGPARLLVPHLYLWKSAKWVNGLQFIENDAPGFWEAAGYHMRGDPWREERYWGD